MSQSRLEIKITKDVSEKDVDINAMSLQAAQSFLLLFESITKIIELTPDNNDIKIQITSGSAVIAADGEKVAKVKHEFDKILENKSTNKELVEQWRRVQSVFAANGLQYEANFYEKGEKYPFYDTLRNRQKLRTRPVSSKKFKTELEFLAGKLIAVGGKNPNIHVEVDGKALPPIACTEGNASKAKAYLYQTIRFSAWAKEVSDTKRYTLCDSYANEEIYGELKSIIVELFSTEQIEALKKVHYQCRDYLDNQEYGKLRKFLRLFAHESTDLNILKMILIVTQSVTENERLKITIETLQKLFDKRFKILNKKKNLSE
jgi:hypothetical protein